MKKHEVIEIMKSCLGNDLGTCDPTVWHKFLCDFDYEMALFNRDFFVYISPNRSLTIADLLNGPLEKDGTHSGV